MNDDCTISGLLAGADSQRLAIADVRGYGLTYGRLRSQIEQTHEALRKGGLGPDDTVGVVLRNGPETAAVLLALTSFCRVAPLNPNYTAAEFDFALHDLNAAAVVTTEDIPAATAAACRCELGLILLKAAKSRVPAEYKLEIRRPLARTECAWSAPEPDNIALLLHTSGTTSRPKLVPLTQRNLCLSSNSVARVLQLAPEDRSLTVMPLFHIHGIVAGLLAPVAAGSAVCCAPGFQATRFFSWIDAARPTWYTAVPTMHQAVLARARHNAATLDWHCLRLIRSSSSPLYSSLWDELEATFGVPVLNAYGMTEAAHQIASVRLPGGPRYRNTVGPSSGPEIAVLDSRSVPVSNGGSGEIALRGEQITRGYLQPPEASSAFAGGWFRTGDEGRIDGNGLLTLTGRLKEIINSGGEKVSPYEVEEALLTHPGVAEAAVFAAPHRMLGEEVASAIVAREGFHIAERDLLRTAGLRLAPHKMPRRVLFVDSIPRGATGKIQRAGLAAQLGLADSPAREHALDEHTRT
ncbi:MAG TPA: AMP-binding protein [Bryobacteraceae bacterium]|nr:AMP-binding protein [Bryobacteraceae bacterium]